MTNICFYFLLLKPEAFFYPEFSFPILNVPALPTVHHLRSGNPFLPCGVRENFAGNMIIAAHFSG
jgi:hypothetical protein